MEFFHQGGLKALGGGVDESVGGWTPCGHYDSRGGGLNDFFHQNHDARTYITYFRTAESKNHSGFC